MSEWLRDALRREAGAVDMPQTMPQTIDRSIRKRRVVVGLAALSIVAVAVAGSAQVAPRVFGQGKADVAADPDDAAARESVVIGSGVDFGMEWGLMLTHTERGARCLELRVEPRSPNCHELGQGWAPGYDVFLDYSRAHDKGYVLGTIPEGSNGVSISLRGGGQWAALIFDGPQGDERDYFVRVFPHGEVSGVIQREEGAPRLAFEITPTENGSNTSLELTKGDALPGFEGFAGETTVLYTEPTAEEPWDVVLRTNQAELCVHIEDAPHCIARPAALDDLRVVASKAVGSSDVIVGLAAPEFEEVVVRRSDGDDRWSPQLMSVTQAGIEHRYFVMAVPGPFIGEVEFTRADGSVAGAPLPSH